MIQSRFGNTSLLVRKTQNVPSKHRWTAKQGRSFQRLLSGISHHLSQGSRIRILTLTSPKGDRLDYLSLNHHWQTLRKRITRTYGSLEYWRLRTFEGQGVGVLHIVFVGPYIPHSWLSKNWNEIHGAFVVYIQELKARYGSKRLASYFVSNYMLHHTFMRQSWSWGWVFRGFAGYWKKLIKGIGFYDALAKWKYVMLNSDPKKRLDVLFGDYYKQCRFKKRWKGDISTLVNLVP